MDRKRGRWLLAPLAALALALAGCGDANVFEGAADSSSDQAKQEEGLQALNDGNFEKAAGVFQALYDGGQRSPEVLRYLASAYVGQSGFDTLSLIEQIAEAEDRADSRSIVYESVTNIFGAGATDGLITAEGLAAKLAKLDAAITVLGTGLAAKAVTVAAAVTSEEDDLAFQRGLYAALHAVLGVVDQLVDPLTGRRILTMAAFDRLTPQQKQDAVDAVTVPDGFDRDIALVDEARRVLLPRLADGVVDANGSATEEQFRRFLVEIGYMDAAGVINGVTDQDLRTYLERLFGLDAG